MTPALSAVYDELLARAARHPRSRALRDDFVRRTGVFPEDHASYGARVAAGWEDALVRGGLAAEIGAELEDASERELADVVARAQRGIFRVERIGERRAASDLWGGGAFLLLRRDELARGPLLDDAESVFVGRIVAGIDGCAVLPGVLWLPGDAVPLLDPILDQAHARALAVDAVADALLRMDHAFWTSSRVRVHHVFRPDALEPAAEHAMAR